MTTLHTGGAKGADTIFSALASKNNHNVKVYSFLGHNVSDNNPKKELIYEENDDEIKYRMYMLKTISKRIDRHVPHDGYVRNLLLRNISIIDNSECVYAIGKFNSDGFVDGGTAWGVYQSILSCIPVYFFDQENGIWYMNDSMFCDLVEIGSSMKIPPISGNYAGIGSRKLNELGIGAIEKLFELGD